MSDPDTPPDPQAAYDERLDAIDAIIDSLPGPAQSLVLNHLEAVRQADRLRAARMGYVLAFVADVEALARRLLSLPAWTPPPPPKEADQTHRGRGL